MKGKKENTGFFLDRTFSFYPEKTPNNPQSLNSGLYWNIFQIK